MKSIKLTGLDGSNPLAFLAALGAFRILNENVANSRISWFQESGVWMPVLYTDILPSVRTLARSLRRRANTLPLTMGKNPQMPVNEFRDKVQKCLNSPEDTAFVSALGSEAVRDQNKPENNADTAFRTMSGAGHQNFLEFMNKICKNCSLRQLNEALFGPWRNADTDYSMRWDPADDRRYALRWKNPSKDKATNTRGANRLAIEALPFFPVMPTSKALETTGFSGHKSNNTFFSWPIWTVPISIDTCRSLLAHSEVQKDAPSLLALSPMGVTVVFRSQRVTNGKFRNFTPAKVVSL